MRTGIAAAIAALAVFAGLVTWALLPPSEKPFLDMIESLRAAGEPLDYDALVGVRLAPADNGAADLREAQEWLKDELGPADKWTVVGPWNDKCADPWQETSTPEEIADLTAFLGRAEPFFTRVAAALAKPAIRFDGGRRDTFGFPSENGVWTIQQTLQLLRAMSRAAPDDARRLDAIASEATLANRYWPVTAIEHIFAMYGADAATNDLRRELQCGRLDAVAARARLDPLLRRPWLSTVPGLFRAERAYIVGVYRTVITGTYNGPSEPWYRRALPRGWVGGGPARESLHAGMAAEFVAECERRGRAAAVPVTDYPSYRAAVLAIWPTKKEFAGLGSTAEIALPAAAHAESAQNLARVALAVAELHARTGAWPASLDDVAPLFPDGVPQDRLTGRPFVYELAASGVRISAPPGAPAETRAFGNPLVWEFGR